LTLAMQTLLVFAEMAALSIALRWLRASLPEQQLIRRELTCGNRSPGARASDRGPLPGLRRTGTRPASWEMP
jgi:hypothetical protein